MNTYSEDKMYEKYSSEVERMQKCIDELQQENKQLKEELEWAIGIVEHNRIISEKNKEIHQLKDNWNYIKKMLKEARQEEYISGYCGTCTDVDIEFLLGKMQELQGSNSNAKD